LREPLQVHHIESFAAFSEIGAATNIISEPPIGFEAWYNKGLDLYKLNKSNGAIKDMVWNN
jgi:hypothetical protein